MNVALLSSCLGELVYSIDAVPSGVSITGKFRKELISEVEKRVESSVGDFVLSVFMINSSFSSTDDLSNHISCSRKNRHAL